MGEAAIGVVARGALRSQVPGSPSAFARTRRMKAMQILLADRSQPTKPSALSIMRRCSGLLSCTDDNCRAKGATVRDAQSHRRGAGKLHAFIAAAETTYQDIQP